MLEGRFARGSGAPYIQAHVSFPRLRLGGVLWLLIDTGADATLLMPADSRKLRVDFRLLSNLTGSQGIGGTARGYRQTAVLSFSDRRYYVQSYLIKIKIAAPLVPTHALPC